MIMTKEETCNYLQHMLYDKNRIAVSRYADGEYFLMTNYSAVVGSGKESSDIGPFLCEAIKSKNQLVCINVPKKHNEIKKDRWYHSHKFFLTFNHSLYGHANWNVFDYLNGSSLLSQFFKKRVLIITGHKEYCERVFSKFGHRVLSVPKLNSFSDPNLSSRIIDVLKNQEFDNIILSAGKISKLLVVNLQPYTNANIVDFGAVLNAILSPYVQDYNLINQWGMSWMKNKTNEEAEYLSKQFFKKL